VGVATRIFRGAGLLKQAHGRQLQIRRQARLNDRLVRIELRRRRWPRPVANRLVVEIPIEVALANPAVHRVAANAQLARQRTLARALLQVVPE
jgi:hypothetical protein